MKKIILSAIILASIVSCKKIAEGGNQGVLRLEEGVERYDSHETRGGGETVSHTSENHKMVKVELKGNTLTAFENGLEQSMVNFLQSGAYSQAANDEALKNKWFNFDQVNFKLGSTNQLEAGSEKQLENLAAILKAFPEVKINVGGYTDKTGNEENNTKISQGRADFIKSELSKLGVGSQVIKAEGYGSKFATVAADASDAERAKDRKMAVRFTK